MSDHDPILLRRLLELRRFPLLAAAELAELAMLAENVVETSHEDGVIVAAPPFSEAIHLILNGKIAVGPASHGAHGAFGLLEVLARRPLTTPAIAVGETRTLQITGSDLREILEENFGLLLIAIRELAGRTLAARVPPRVAAPRTAAFALAAPGGSPLGLVERMLALRRQAPFAPTSRERGERGAETAPLEAIAILAHASKETTCPTGTVIARSGDPAHSACFLLEGTVRVTRDGAEPYLLGPGGSIGVLEGLAGLRHAATAEVVAPVRALEIAGSVIFDVIEDHTELGLAVVEALAGGLLDAAGR